MRRAPNIPLLVDSEFGQLTHAVLGYGANYHRTDLRLVLIEDLLRLKDVLEANGVAVFPVQPMLERAGWIADQLSPRDIGFVIGDTLFISQMREERRAAEWQGLRHLFPQVAGKKVFVPNNAFIEGGDVLVHGKNVFVGLGSRTCSSGVSFLRKSLGREFSVIPIPIREMHLDLVFNIVAERAAIIYEPLIIKLPPEMVESFTLVRVSLSEYQRTGVNSLGLGGGIVLVRAGCEETCRGLEALGLDVISLAFDGIPHKDAGIRCSIMPLARSPIF